MNDTESCFFCSTKHTDWGDGGGHDFRIQGDTLYYFDYTFGWEGITVSFCPMCGRKLLQDDKEERD